MIKSIRTQKALVSEKDVVFNELYEIIALSISMEKKFRARFEYTEIQKEVVRIIEESELRDGEVLHLLLFGSTGSGKSTVVNAIITDYMLRYPGLKALAARRTYSEIEDSTFSAFKDFWDRYEVQYTENKKNYIQRLANGSNIRHRSAEKTAQGKTDKAHHLGSTEYTMAVLEEVDEIPVEFSNTLPGRMRQKGTGCRIKVIFYVCNPPSELHWLWDFFFNDPTCDPDDPASRKRALHMPVEANVEHVGEGYIRQLYEAYADNPQLLQRLARGEFGPDVKGDPIFYKAFNRDVHVAKGSISKNWDKHIPLSLGIDFGFRRPAMVVLQDDPVLDQIRIYKAILGHNELLEPFLDKCFNILCREFPGAEFEIFCDAAGKTRHNQGLTKDTAVDVLRRRGFNPKFKTSDVAPGLNIIHNLLTKMTPTRYGPVPAILIDPDAEYLIKGLEFGYCNDKQAPSGALKPVKDGIYEHPMDCLRYILMFKRKHEKNHSLTSEATRRGSWKRLGSAEDDPSELVERRGRRRKVNLDGSSRENRSVTAANYGFSKKRRW